MSGNQDEEPFRLLLFMPVCVFFLDEIVLTVLLLLVEFESHVFSTLFFFFFNFMLP